MVPHNMSSVLLKLHEFHALTGFWDLEFSNLVALKVNCYEGLMNSGSLRIFPFFDARMPGGSSNGDIMKASSLHAEMTIMC